MSHRQGRGQRCSQGPRGADCAQWERGGSHVGLNLAVTSGRQDDPVMVFPPVRAVAVSSQNYFRCR